MADFAVFARLVGCQSQWITSSQGRCKYIEICTCARPQPQRIALRVSTAARLMVAKVILVQSGGRIVSLSWEPNVERKRYTIPVRVLLRQRGAEGFSLHTPHPHRHIAHRIYDCARRAQVVWLHVMHLAAVGQQAYRRVIHPDRLLDRMAGIAVVTQPVTRFVVQRIDVGGPRALAHLLPAATEFSQRLFPRRHMPSYRSSAIKLACAVALLAQKCYERLPI